MLGNAFADAIYGAVAGIISLLCAGRIAETAGVSVLLLISLACVLLSALSAFIFRKRFDAQGATESFCIESCK